MPRPLLAIVTGRPGSGKTTLAERLAKELRLPLVSRDALKESYLQAYALGEALDSEVSGRVFEAFLWLIEDMLRQGVSLIAEAAFQHKVWSPSLEPHLPIANVRIVVCEISAARAWERVTERARLDPARGFFHPFPESHRGAEEPYEPPRLDIPTLIVDTAEGYDPSFEEIVAFLK
jgi:predicted kinase